MTRQLQARLDQCQGATVLFGFRRRLEDLVFCILIIPMVFIFPEKTPLPLSGKWTKAFNHTWNDITPESIPDNGKSQIEFREYRLCWVGSHEVVLESNI